MAAAAVPLVLGATALQAIGSIQQGNAQAAAYNTQAQGARYNAAVSREQAQQALRVSSAQQMQQRREARQFLGRQRAMAAQAGVGMGGSTADVLERSETLAELDALNLAYEGLMRARGYNTQADLDDFAARAYVGQAKSAKRAGAFGALGSLLSGAYAVSGSFGGAAPKSSVGASGSGLRAPAGFGYGSNLRFG